LEEALMARCRSDADDAMPDARGVDEAPSAAAAVALLGAAADMGRWSSSSPYLVDRSPAGYRANGGRESAPCTTTYLHDQPPQAAINQRSINQTFPRSMEKR
jgi:hypothetical protein